MARPKEADHTYGLSLGIGKEVVKRCGGAARMIKMTPEARQTLINAAIRYREKQLAAKGKAVRG